jgi:hypothetical protein
MNTRFSNWLANTETTSGPRIVAIGLAIVIAAAWMPAAPIVTGISLIALGATCATRERFRGADVLRMAMAGHVVIYGGLYVLFVGAVCHALPASASDEMRLAQALDIGASVVPMSVVLRQSLAAIFGGGDAPAR